MCLDLLQRIEPASLVDLGCGSGVLAIAAAKLGFSPVVALDCDQAAVKATRANASVNGVQLEARVADVLTDAIADASVGLANLERSLVERLAATGRAPATLVASGFLGSDRLELPGWRRDDRRVRAGWAAELLRRA
jgi:ribosomal protein L11 methyltransferase